MLRAREEYERASQHFRDVTSGLPAPDGGLLSRQSCIKPREALARYVAALTISHDFEMNGILPVNGGPVVPPTAGCGECVNLLNEFQWTGHRAAHIQKQAERIAPEDPRAARYSTEKLKEARKAVAAAQQALNDHRFAAGH